MNWPIYAFAIAFCIMALRARIHRDLELCVGSIMASAIFLVLAANV